MCVCALCVRCVCVVCACVVRVCLYKEAGWCDQLVWNAAETLGSARAALVGAEDAAEVGEAPRSVEELVERPGQSAERRAPMI